MKHSICKLKLVLAYGEDQSHTAQAIGPFMMAVFFGVVSAKNVFEVGSKSTIPRT